MNNPMSQAEVRECVYRILDDCGIRNRGVKETTDDIVALVGPQIEGPRKLMARIGSQSGGEVDWDNALRDIDAYLATCEEQGDKPCKAKT